MAANQSVVDELVVKLTLDAKDYKNTDKQVSGLVDQTERKQVTLDAKRKKRDTEQIKRNKETLKSVKELAEGFKKLAFTIGTMLGVGSVTGLVGTVVALASMETGLRRAAVSTGLSNRELQAYSSTMRRLGADAQGGAQAIADLAREQKQFAVTGTAPTIQALSRLGVRVTPTSSLADVLGQAQQIYRAAPQAQRGQIEANLAAQGVSPDLIVAIKSNIDAQKAYSKSFAESTDDNEKTQGTLNDVISSVSNAGTAFANTLATAVQPYAAQLGDWAHNAAVELGNFVGKVLAAGGGVDGFLKALDETSPEMASKLHTLINLFSGLADTILVIKYGFSQLSEGLTRIGKWIFTHLGGTSQENIGKIGDWISEAWKDAVRGGPEGVKLTANAAARVKAGALGGAHAGAPANRPGVAENASDLMDKLITQYGFSVPQAAAIVANMQGESSLIASKVTTEGGGLGARGLAQWRGPRIAAFKARYGVFPDQATVDQQLQFLATDPYERSRLNRALAAPGGASTLGERVSALYETHGKQAEDVRRGTVASQLASQYGTNGQTGAGQSIHIQSLTVQANNSQEFVGGIQRQSGVQNYNSGVR